MRLDELPCIARLVFHFVELKSDHVFETDFHEGLLRREHGPQQQATGNSTIFHVCHRLQGSASVTGRSARKRFGVSSAASSCLANRYPRQHFLFGAPVIVF